MLSSASLISPGAREVRSQSGTAWLEGTQTQLILEQLGEYREQSYRDNMNTLSQLMQRHVIGRTGDYTYVSYVDVTSERPAFTNASNPGPILQLPYWIKSVDQIVIEGQTYERLRDYRQDGSYLLFTGSTPLFSAQRLGCFGVKAHTGTLSEFWSRVFGYYDVSPGSDRFYRALHKAVQTTYSTLTLMELLAAALDLDVIEQESTVLSVKTSSDSSQVIVVTDTKTLHGGAEDTPVVVAGDKLFPGDTGFDSLRLLDTSSPLPSWFTELKLPRRYFSYSPIGEISVTSVPQPPVGYSLTGSQVHIEVPLSADAQAVAEFNAKLKLRETETGYSLASYLAQKDSLSVADVDSLLATNFDWLGVLWSTWLRFGVSISVVRALPSEVALRRLTQVRRIVPPWLTHVVHFLTPPDDPNDLFC